MHVVCVAIPEKGHLHPLLPTLRRLESLGHSVVVAAVRDLSAELLAARVRGVAHVLQVPPPPAGFVTAGAEFAQRLADPAWLAAWIEALLIDCVPAQVTAIENLLRAEGPDVVVADPMIYAAVIACSRLQIPWAGVSSSLNPVTPTTWSSDLSDTLRALDVKRRRAFVDHGVDVPTFRVSDAVSPWLNVVFSVDAWAPRAAADNPGVFAVGAPFDDDECAHRDFGSAFPFHRLQAGRARVYVSFGSQAWCQPRLFALVFAAASSLHLQVIASVGDLVDDPVFMQSLPADAIAVRFAPQLQILDAVDVFVSHGGANSVVEALWYARPLVLLPLCNDQPLQARFVTRAGAGVVLDINNVDVATLRAALSTAVSDEMGLRVRALSHALRQGGGPTQVAHLIEKLALGRRPLQGNSA